MARKGINSSHRSGLFFPSSEPAALSCPFIRPSSSKAPQKPFYVLSLSLYLMSIPVGYPPSLRIVMFTQGHPAFAKRRRAD